MIMGIATLGITLSMGSSNIILRRLSLAWICFSCISFTSVLPNICILHLFHLCVKPEVRTKTPAAALFLFKNRTTAGTHIDLQFPSDIRTVNPLLSIRKYQENEAKSKEYSKGSYRDINSPSGQFYPGNYCRAKERSTFGKDIIDPEIFSGILWRDNLGIIGTRQRLDGPLEASYTESQYPEMQQCPECKRIQTHSKIAGYTHKD